MQRDYMPDGFQHDIQIFINPRLAILLYSMPDDFHKVFNVIIIIWNLYLPFTSQWKSYKRREFILKLSKLGFEGPYPDTCHQFTVFEKHRPVIHSSA